jgi:hypothetical protein
VSLFCDETGRDIEFGDPLFAATRVDIEDFYALSEEALSRIPPQERLGGPVGAEKGGEDIHAAKSTRNFNGSYTVVGFELSIYLFSISQETAERYLPVHSKHRAHDAAMILPGAVVHVERADVSGLF